MNWDAEFEPQQVRYTGPDLDRRLSELESRVEKLTDELHKHRHGYRWEIGKFE